MILYKFSVRSEKMFSPIAFKIILTARWTVSSQVQGVGKAPNSAWIALLPIGSRHVYSVLMCALIATLNIGYS
jgi:hypothetical protein